MVGFSVVHLAATLVATPAAVLPAESAVQVTRPPPSAAAARVVPGTTRPVGTADRSIIPLAGSELRFDTYFTEPQRDDRSVVAIAPAVWSTDASEAVVGVRLRSNYRGHYNRWTVWLHRGLQDASSSVDGIHSATLGQSVDFRVRLENPFALRTPGGTQSLEGWVQEGVVGARVRLASTRWPADSVGFTRTGVIGQWVATRQTGFLNPALWDNAGTVEVGLFREWRRVAGPTRRGLRVEGRGGYAYTPDRNVFSSGNHDGAMFGRFTATASWRRRIVGFDVGVRMFGGAYLGADPPARQRGIPVNGADPYETLENPMVRAQGAPLVIRDIFYHSPGNLNLRGYQPGLGGRWGAAVNLQVEKRVISRSRGVLRSIGLVGFWDGGIVDTLAVTSFSGRGYKPIYDAGPGLHAWFHIGDVSFPLRVEFPVYLSSPFVAHDRGRATEFVDFRWLISLQPIF